MTIPQSCDSYGNKLIRQTIDPQFRGSITYDWSKNGLIATVLINVNRLKG